MEDRIAPAMQHLAAEALRHPGTMRATARETLGAMIARLDACIAAQTDAICGHPEFRALESAWRGLGWLLEQVRPDGMQQVRVLDITRAELAEAASGGPGRRWRQAVLARKLYYAPFRPEGVPFATLILDGEIGWADLPLLADLAPICAACHAPLIANAGPELFGLPDFAALPADPRGVLEHAGGPDWQALRAARESAYLMLCLPRVLVGEPGLRIGAAHAMGANIARSHAGHGLAGRFRGRDNGRIDGLSTSGSSAPVEVALTDRAEAEFARAGFAAVCWHERASVAAFISAQSVHAPRPGATDRETLAEMLRARLPYLMPPCRIAQCVLKMAVAWDGPLTGGPDAFDAHVRNWLDGMVLPRHWEKPPEVRAARPLVSASFEIEPGGPGGVTARLAVIPGYPGELGAEEPVVLDLSLPILAR